MGSKRKNPTKLPSSPPPSDPPSDVNKQNHKNPNTVSPSKFSKKAKPSTATEVSTLNDGGALLQWDEADFLKLLKALITFRDKNGALPTDSNMIDFIKEIQDWAPAPISEKILQKRVRQLHFKFQHSLKPVPHSSEFDRSFYPLALKVWGPENLKEKGSPSGIVKEFRMEEEKSGVGSKKDKSSQKQKSEKKKLEFEREDEEEVEVEKDSDNDEGTEEKAEKNTSFENGEDHGKSDLLGEGDNGHSYKYLRITLEEYWAESKMNTDALYAALPKVDPAKAKHLDEQFRKLFVGMLKLKMESNKVSNEIIRASLPC